MTELLVTVLGIALVDSLNPSAIAVTLALLSGTSYTTRVTTYVAGVFCGYFGIGVLLMLGLDVVFVGAGRLLENPVAYAVQGVIGALLLLYSIFAPSSKKEAKIPTPRSPALGAVFLLGITVTAVEFSTALPYLGAIGLLARTGLSAGQWLPILVVYNLIFIAPPLLLLGAYKLLGSRIEERLAQLRKIIQRSSHEALQTIIGIIGFLLLANSLAYFRFFGLIPMS